MKTGTAMSRIINTRNVKRIKSSCRNCFHFKKNKSVEYCAYYDEFQPNRTKCARFMRVER